MCCVCLSVCACVYWLAIWPEFGGVDEVEFSVVLNQRKLRTHTTNKRVVLQQRSQTYNHQTNNKSPHLHLAASNNRQSLPSRQHTSRKFSWVEQEKLKLNWHWVMMWWCGNLSGVSRLRRPGLTFDSFRQSLKTHLFGDWSALWLFWMYRRYIKKFIYLSIYLTHTHTHTYTHQLNGPLSRTTRVSRHQKSKTNLDFPEARDSEWQWHQLGCVQVCTSLQTDNHASTPPLNFLQAGCPSCRPTNSVKALKAQQSTVHTIHKFK